MTRPGLITPNKNPIMKIRYRLFSLLTILVTAAAVSARAATCSVPTADYPTIQSAVDDPTCATINVAPGVYSENISITRSVTLNGAQAGQPTAGRISAGPAESTVVGVMPTGAHPVFAANAQSVTIDGFTVKNAVTLDAAIGIQINPGSSDVVMLNNFIDGITTADVGPNGNAEAVFVQNGSFNLNIGNNDMRNIASNGSA